MSELDDLIKILDTTNYRNSVIPLIDIFTQRSVEFTGVINAELHNYMTHYIHVWDFDSKKLHKDFTKAINETVKFGVSTLFSCIILFDKDDYVSCIRFSELNKDLRTLLKNV